MKSKAHGLLRKPSWLINVGIRALCDESQTPYLLEKVLFNLRKQVYQDNANSIPHNLYLSFQSDFLESRKSDYLESRLQYSLLMCQDEDESFSSI